MKLVSSVRQPGLPVAGRGGILGAIAIPGTILEARGTRASKADLFAESVMQELPRIGVWLVLFGAGLVACESEPLKGHGDELGGSAGIAGNAVEMGGTGGHTIGGTGAGGTGGVAPNMGLPFGGSCLMPDSCTDEWDSLFGALTLEQLCTAQGGTWSRRQCDKTPWAKTCTQLMADAYYVQYLPLDGVCVDGEEGPL